MVTRRVKSGFRTTSPVRALSRAFVVEKSLDIARAMDDAEDLNGVLGGRVEDQIAPESEAAGAEQKAGTIASEFRIPGEQTEGIIEPPRHAAGGVWVVVCNVVEDVVELSLRLRRDDWIRHLLSCAGAPLVALHRAR